MIERFYYDEAIREWDKIKKECDAENALLTETERQEKQERIQREADEIIKMAEMQMSMEHRVPDISKIKTFQNMIPEILQMAEISSMNICIEMKKPYQAHIRLSTGYVNILKNSLGTERETMMYLLQEAGDIYGSVCDNLLKFDFYFDLYGK